MRRLKSRYLLGAALVALLVAIPLRSIAAAQPNGITLSPFQQAITIQPTDTSKSFNLTLTNHTAGLQEISLTSRDFGSLNDTGGILLEGSNSYTQKYGLTTWMTLGTDTVLLRPNETQSVPVTITNRDSLQPGGHYGAVVASVNSLNDQSGNKVVINQQLLSLVFVDKTGGDHYDLKLVDATQNGNWLHLPSTVHLRFQNPGNVHVAPRGVVKLVSPGGGVVAQGIINVESAYILPESFRDVYVPLTTVGKTSVIPGLYHVEVDYRYDGLDHYAKKSFTVRFINLPGMVILLVIIVFLMTLVLRYKRRIAKSK